MASPGQDALWRLAGDLGTAPMTLRPTGRLFEALARWWTADHPAGCAHVVQHEDVPRCAWLCDQHVWCLPCVKRLTSDGPAPVPTVCDLCGADLSDLHGGGVFTVSNLSIFVAVCDACEKE